MKKLRCDSKWQTIPPGARAQVIRWLFDEGLGYQAVLERAEKEFGIKASKSSLGRFYQYVAEERLMAGLNLPEVSAEEFRGAALKILGAATLNAGLSHARPEVSKQFIPLVKLFLQHSDGERKERWLELEAMRLGVQQRKACKP